MSRSFWLALGLIAVTIGAPQLRAGVAEKIAAGDAALTKFDLDSAIAAYREARQLDAANYESAWKLARALVDKGTLTKDRDDQKPFYVEAEQLAREAIRLIPNNRRVTRISRSRSASSRCLKAANAKSRSPTK